VGKHAAPEGAARHPLVSEALAARPEQELGAHSEDAARDSEVGWPGAPAPEGGGLGWPADLPAAGSQAAATSAERAQPRGWRRFFGLSRVA
jgi:hypothetical protein